MKIKLLLIFSLFLCLAELSGKHIIGGEIFYECLFRDTIRNTISLSFTMKVYRDCSTSDGAEFDEPAPIGIYRKNRDGSYTIIASFGAGLISKGFVDPKINNPCLVVPPNVCVEEATYKWNFELPVINDSYVIAYQRCCRNRTITNIIDPEGAGAAYTLELTPAAQKTCNSSPRFNNFPPIIICAGVPLVFDHSANDPDGNTITYEFCPPYTAGGQAGSAGHPGNPSDCNGVIPDPNRCPPPFDFVDFRTPLYTYLEPMAGNPVVKINPLTGVITGTPTTQGQFVVGVCMKEYNANGELLSIVQRDFQFNVARCDNSVVAQVQSDSILKGKRFILNSCGNNTIDFINLSYDKNKIVRYDWSFDINGNIVTKNSRDASITFPGLGTYTGKMIVNAGLECSDTSDISVNIYPDIHAKYNFAYDTCIAGPVVFNDLSRSGSGQLTNWTWNFEKNGKSNSQNPNYTFLSPGNKSVVLSVKDINGCVDDTLATIPYFPVPPLLIINPNTFSGCQPLKIKFNNLSIPIDSTYTINWDFGDGKMGHEISPEHIYEDIGVYSVNLDITSPIGCHTSAFYPNWINVSESPIADFDYDPKIFNSFQKNISITDLSKRGKTIEYLIDNITRLNNRNPNYTFRDTGVHSIKQVVIHQNGCIDTLIKYIDVEPKVTFFMPNAFTPNGDGKNDVFNGTGIVDYMQNFEMSIWDRWGARIFRTKDPNEGWNGQFDNREANVPNGVYVYIVSFDGPRGLKVKQKGYATVVR